VSTRFTAVVLAGGTSRRFGSDKLNHPVQGRSLLDFALDQLSADVDVIVVGPERPTSRAVRFICESPPGGGPAAALVAGLRAALRLAEQPIAVLPADAPRAAAGAHVLIGRLTEPDPVPAVVAVDADGHEQPLQLALQPIAARALIANAGPDGAADASVRRLLHTLDPPPVPQPLAPAELFDIDTVDQLVAWQLQTSPAVTAILDAVAALPPSTGPTVVALDGPRGAGKSTLAAALRLRTGATIIATDDLRRAGLSELIRRPTAGLIVLDGVHSAPAELADLVQLAVYVAIDLPGREVRPDQPAGFDLLVSGASYTAKGTTS
jgi:molybdopterin-guanine dinucleotide biosynthesis protein A